MKCRDLIVYILQNGLENEDVITDGKFIGFLTVPEAAAKIETGVNTIHALNLLGKLDIDDIKGGMYIPVTSVETFIGGNDV